MVINGDDYQKMDQIVEESEIDYLSALNLRSEGTNLSRDSADATIRKFIQDKWLRMEVLL